VSGHAQRSYGGIRSTPKSTRCKERERVASEDLENGGNEEHTQEHTRFRKVRATGA
jgi:hypothetical protein